MTYVLPDSFLKDLSDLKINYEAETKIELDPATQPYALSIFFGAKDIKKRDGQIKFIASWLQALSPFLKPDHRFKNEEEIQNHLLGLRVMLCICHYIKHQIDTTYTVRNSRHASMVMLIDKALKIQGKNTLDKNTLACCLLSTERFLEGHNRLEEINQQVKHPFTELEWRKLISFIKKQCHKLDEQHKNNYPITSVMMPVFSAPMQAAGYTTGYLLGDLLAHSTSYLSTRYMISAHVGSGIYCAMAAGSSCTSLGILFLAPTYVGRLMDTLFGVSVAYVLGTTMSILGSGMGWGVGMTLDLSWKLLSQACTLINEACLDTNMAPLTGFNLVDAKRVVDGLQLEVQEVKELAEECNTTPGYENKPVTLEITNDGLNLQIGDEKAVIKWDGNNMPYGDELIAKLKERLVFEGNDEPDLEEGESSETTPLFN